jgi:hypothetical protein
MKGWKIFRHKMQIKVEQEFQSFSLCIFIKKVTFRANVFLCALFFDVIDAMSLRNSEKNSEIQENASRSYQREKFFARILISKQMQKARKSTKNAISCGF